MRVSDGEARVENENASSWRWKNLYDKYNVQCEILKRLGGAYEVGRRFGNLAEDKLRGRNF